MSSKPKSPNPPPVVAPIIVDEGATVQAADYAARKARTASGYHKQTITGALIPIKKPGLNTLLGGYGGR